MNNENKCNDVYCSCMDLEHYSLIITTTCDTYKVFLTPCCEMALTRTTGDNIDNPNEAINNFIEFRRNMIEENKRVYHTDDRTRIYTNQCVNCPKYIVKDWSDRSDNITFFALSMGHAPCQSKCIYCYNGSYNYELTDEGKEVYDKVFNFMKFLKTNDFINKNAYCQTSSGEISIHPYKDKILDIVDGFNVMFLSNCFKFDQGIANHLTKSPGSYINLSIDSGTSVTWKKVKGFNNFYTVVSNLYKYRRYCDQTTNTQQLTLKYIVMPDVNTRCQDYLGVIKLMKKLDVRNLIISRNLCYNPDNSSDEYRYLFDCIIELAYTCRSNGLSYTLFFGGFTEDEQLFVDQQVKQRLQI